MTRSVTTLVLCTIAVGCGGNIGDPAVDPDSGPRSADAGIISLDAGADAAPMLVPAPCADGDARFSDPVTGNCYLRFDETVTWTVASARCQAVGAHLVSITSAEEDAIVAGIAPNMAPNDPTEFDVWIGGNDIATEMTWAWEVTMEPFAFTNWRDGEPNNNNLNDPDGEDCSVFEGDNLEWDDRSCSLGILKYVCEREATLE